MPQVEHPTDIQQRAEKNVTAARFMNGSVSFLSVRPRSVPVFHRPALSMKMIGLDRERQLHRNLGGPTDLQKQSNGLLLVEVDLLSNGLRKVNRHLSIRAGPGTLNVVESTDDLDTSKLEG